MWTAVYYSCCTLVQMLLVMELAAQLSRNTAREENSLNIYIDWWQFEINEGIIWDKWLISNLNFVLKALRTSF